MAYPSTPRDAQNIPVGCVYVPGVGFVALQGGTPVNTDVNGNASAPVNVSGTVTATGVADGTNGSAAPSASTQIGASDGTNLQALRVESATNKNLRAAVYNGANELAIDASGNASVKLVAGSALIGNVELVDSGGTNKASISAGGAVKVDGSGVIGSTTIQATSGTALAADQSNTELRVSNYVKSAAAGDTALTLGQTTKAGSLPVTLASDQGNLAIQVAAIASALSQANQIPVSSSAAQGKLTLTGTLTANSDNSITFSGGATVARRIRIQNESGGIIYWETDATASAGSPSLAAPAANSVSVEWIAVQCTTLHIFVPSGGTTTLNGSGGVKVTAYA